MRNSYYCFLCGTNFPFIKTESGSFKPKFYSDPQSKNLVIFSEMKASTETLCKTCNNIQKGGRIHIKYLIIPCEFPSLQKLMGFREIGSRNLQSYSQKSFASFTSQKISFDINSTSNTFSEKPCISSNSF